MSKQSDVTSAMKVVPKQYLTTREIRGECVVIDTSTGNYHVFNNTGSLIWKEILSGRESAEIIEKIVADHAVERERAALDFAGFVRNLREYGLLE